MLRWLWTFLLIITLNSTVYAGQTLVLIHGYLSEGGVWRGSGVIPILQQAGWVDAGHLNPDIPIHGIIAGTQTPTNRYVYTITLPSEMPLMGQLNWLVGYLNHLKTLYPDNDLILAGHSAGGVLARLAMVYVGASIQGLITIASPHLGTDTAEIAATAANSPLNWFLTLMGSNTLSRSEALYWDLVRERPGSFLFWLNRQPHPKARYISVVRANTGFLSDNLVPAYSQNMNNVVALQGKSLIIPSFGPHSLQPADGGLLAFLLANW